MGRLKSLQVSSLLVFFTFSSTSLGQNQKPHPAIAEIATLLKQGKKESVEQQVLSHLKSNSRNLELLLALGQLLGTHKELGLAETCFRRSTELSPGSFPAQFNLGLTLFQDGRSSQAIDPLAKAATLSPSSFEARYILGRALLETGDKIGGIRRLREARTLRPRHSGLLALLGVEYLQNGYYIDAVQILKEATELEPSNEKLQLLLIQAYHTNFDLAQAAEQARQTAKKFSRSANAQFRLAYQLQMEGKFSESEVAYQRALALDPGHLQANLALGQMRQRQTRYDEAIFHYERVLAAEPQSSEARMGLARCSLALKQYPRASNILTQLLRENPSEPQVHLLLFQLYQVEGKLEESASERQRFLELTTSSSAPTGMSHSLPASRAKRFPASEN
jgi:tetratricopeptide (TPR) repeat protein